MSVAHTERYQVADMVVVVHTERHWIADIVVIDHSPAVNNSSVAVAVAGSIYWQIVSADKILVVNDMVHSMTVSCNSS
jgi:hypothetical protein